MECGYAVNILRTGAALALGAWGLFGCQAVAPQTTAGGSRVDGPPTADGFSQTPEGWSIVTQRPGRQFSLDPDGRYNTQSGFPATDLGLRIPVVGPAGATTTTTTTREYAADGSLLAETVTQVPVYAVLVSSNPADTGLRGLSTGYGADGFSVAIAELSALQSAPIAAADAQVLGSLAQIGAITEAQRAVAEAQIAAGATLAEALASLGLSVLVPGQ